MDNNRRQKAGADVSKAIGLMFNEEGTELQPDPDERTDADMDAMYGDELRREESLNIKLYISQTMQKVEDKLKEMFGRKL